MALVLKTSDVQASVGSNPTSSVKKHKHLETIKSVNSIILLHTKKNAI